MKKCIAFLQQPRVPNAWRQCCRRPLRGSVFCRQHQRVLEGVMLGVFVNCDEIEKAMLKEMAVKSQVPS